jgi:hypothetical protein
VETRHDKATIISMAAVALAVATTLHEAVGHGVTAWVRGDVVTQLTSNHLSSMRPDRWVDAGGTIANLIAGTVSLQACVVAGGRANLRYFLWIFGALNLLAGSGYFLFSGVLGVGDWEQVIAGVPHYAALRAGMAVFGALLYVVAVRWIAQCLQPFVADRGEYNTLGRMAYLTACAVDCVAGAFDPLGMHLLLISTIPAVFGGFSGLLWADVFLRGARVDGPMRVQRSVAWWVAAVVVAGLFVGVLGPGINFRH